MSQNFPDPTELKALFSSSEFKNAVSNGDDSLATQLFYQKLFGAAEHFKNLKHLREKEIAVLLEDAFQGYYQEIFNTRKDDHFLISLEPTDKMRQGRINVKLYFDGEFEVSHDPEFPPISYTAPSEIKKLIAKSEMRKRILQIGYIPEE